MAEGRRIGAAGHGHAASVGLHFTITPARRVDLDNLVRPAMAGLRDVGIQRTAFTGLVSLLAIKSEGAPVGLRVWFGADQIDDVDAPFVSMATLVGPCLAEGDREGLRAWRQNVATHGRSLPQGAVGLDVTLRTPRSPIGLLKPLIDGMEPVLGRDPRSRHEFSPKDERITWLRVRRSLDADQEWRVKYGILTG